MELITSPYIIPGLKYKIESYLSPKEKAERIRECICDYLKMPVEVMIQKKRERHFVYARQLVMYFLKNKTRLSLIEIAAMVSPKDYCRDHTTVIHGIQHLKDLIFSEEKVKTDVDNIKRLL